MKNKIVIYVRNIVIGFFALVFIMGFFSKSIINLFLPKVMTESAMQGTVTRTMNIEGVIEAQKIYKLRLADTVIVEEYLVKNGEYVNAGSPLFRISKTYGIEQNNTQVDMLRLQRDSQKLRIQQLKSTGYEIELKNISALEKRLKEAQEELANQQKLFDAGVISLQELEQYKKSIEQMQLDIELAKLQLEGKQKQNAANIKAEENGLKNIELQIQAAENKQNTKVYVDDEGIYYSETAGIVTYINEGQDMIQGNTVILQIADNTENQDLVFSADISSQDYEFVKSAGIVELVGDKGAFGKTVNIAALYKHGNGDIYRLECAIKNEEQGEFTIGQKKKAIIKQSYPTNEYLKVPKASVIVFGEYIAGSEGIVYLLEENDGVLGKEYRAKSKNVKLVEVGDNDVIITGLENVEKPRVIVNLSYKIQDGVKVFLWQ